jgi:Cu-processing system permease protein
MSVDAMVQRGPHTASRIAFHELRDVTRGRLIIGYTAFFGLLTEGLLRFNGSGVATMVSLMNVVLFLVPLVTIVFGTLYLHNAREFIELLLAQPLRRAHIHAGLYLGLTLPLAGSVALGIAIPFAIHGGDGTAPAGGLAMLIGVGVVLTMIFSAIALAIAVRTDDKVKGLGVGIVAWLAFAVLYDGVVLILLMTFRDRALDRPALALMVANPIDLARVLLLLRFDIAALMGYTGASLQRFFGSNGGSLIAIGALMMWVAVPLALSRLWFNRKDF